MSGAIDPASRFDMENNGAFPPAEASHRHHVGLYDSPSRCLSGFKRPRPVDVENTPSHVLWNLPKPFFDEDTPLTPRNKFATHASPYFKVTDSVLSSGKGFGIHDSPIPYLSDEDCPPPGIRALREVPITFPAGTKSPERPSKTVTTVFGTPSKKQRRSDDDAYTVFTGKSSARSQQTSLELSSILHHESESLLDETLFNIDASVSSDNTAKESGVGVEVDVAGSLDISTVSVYSAVFEMDPKSIFNWAFVCACNMNRSMSAHSEMLARGYDVRRLNSYGTSDAVRLPARNGPAVFDFGVNYEQMLHHLSGKVKYGRDGRRDAAQMEPSEQQLDRQWTQELGLEHMLRRNAQIKQMPESWHVQMDVQALMHDFVLCFDSTVYEAVLADLKSRFARLLKLRDGPHYEASRVGVTIDPECFMEREIAVVLLHTNDTFSDAAKAASSVADFADAVCSAWKRYKEDKLTPRVHIVPPSVADLLATAIDLLQKAHVESTVKFTTVTFPGKKI